ncbi:UPF0149 family protein [Thiorhodococcus mannitoliphagus]|uniref:UPF0149 family protein n=1 Tax=Thiorhodococcus mannitoliphagus TaxID=329406 RepID=A0A6P1DU44_9GAMM|nr:UPF0149 family protein [Thiorhodococcus mannitoliphagus]NEX21299.1 UPF0149 family protein [Thiorhodococcus mannitoliphagus]
MTDARCIKEHLTDIDDAQLAFYLEASPLNPTVAEAHGMLCGVVCGAAADPVALWLEQLLPSAAAGGTPDLEAREALREIAEPLEKAVRGPDLAVEMLLPQESAALAERATAVYDWVRGFLYAMGILGISELDLSGEAREVYRDLAEVTRMDLEHLEDSEENEQALMEITEFVRVAAMIIHDARVQAPQQMKDA